MESLKIESIFFKWKLWFRWPDLMPFWWKSFNSVLRNVVFFSFSPFALKCHSAIWSCVAGTLCSLCLQQKIKPCHLFWLFWYLGLFWSHTQLEFVAEQCVTSFQSAAWILPRPPSALALEPQSAEPRLGLPAEWACASSKGGLLHPKKKENHQAFLEKDGSIGSLSAGLSYGQN